MNRPLSTVEKVIYHVDRGAPLNFTCIARVGGPLTVAMVEAALVAVRARHPLLRMRIVVAADGTPCFHADGAPPSLRVVTGGDWQAEAEREVNEPLPTAAGPLVRCVVVTHADDDHTLLLTFHHSIGDGMSGAYLMRDLVLAAAQAANGATPSLPALADALPVDDAFPASVRGFSGWLRRLRFFLREAGAMVRYGKPVKARRDRDAFAYERRVRLVHVVLDAEFTARLTARARAENTTVHGALSAALLLGVLRDANAQGMTRVAFGSPVNIRNDLEPAIGENVGFYVSMLPFNGPVGTGQDFWEIARAVRADMARDIAGNVHLAALGGMGLVFALLGGNRREPRALCEHWENTVQTTTGLTNLGRLAIGTHFATAGGALDIGEFHFIAAPSALGDFMSTATSLHGRLSWNFIWTDPVFDAGHVQALTDDIVATLRAAVDRPN